CTLLAGQRCRVRGLSEHLDGQNRRFLQRQRLFVFLPQHRLCHGIIDTDARGLPAAVIAGRIAVVELKAVVTVPASKGEAGTERAHAWDVTRTDGCRLGRAVSSRPDSQQRVGVPDTLSRSLPLFLPPSPSSPSPFFYPFSLPHPRSSGRDR